VHDPDVLAGRRRVLEDEVARRATAAAVRIDPHVHVQVTVVCKKTEVGFSLTYPGRKIWCREGIFYPDRKFCTQVKDFVLGWKICNSICLFIFRSETDLFTFYVMGMKTFYPGNNYSGAKQAVKTDLSGRLSGAGCRAPDKPIRTIHT
jgi:hypothetical protein